MLQHFRIFGLFPHTYVYGVESTRSPLIMGISVMSDDVPAKLLPSVILWNLPQGCTKNVTFVVSGCRLVNTVRSWSSPCGQGQNHFFTSWLNRKIRGGKNHFLVLNTRGIIHTYLQIYGHRSHKYVENRQWWFTFSINDTAPSTVEDLSMKSKPQLQLTEDSVPWQSIQLNYNINHKQRRYVFVCWSFASRCWAQ